MENVAIPFEKLCRSTGQQIVIDTWKKTTFRASGLWKFGTKLLRFNVTAKLWTNDTTEMTLIRFGSNTPVKLLDPNEVQLNPAAVRSAPVRTI